MTEELLRHIDKVENMSVFQKAFVASAGVVTLLLAIDNYKTIKHKLREVLTKASESEGAKELVSDISNIMKPFFSGVKGVVKNSEEIEEVEHHGSFFTPITFWVTFSVSLILLGLYFLSKTLIVRTVFGVLTFLVTLRLCVALSIPLIKDLMDSFNVLSTQPEILTGIGSILIGVGITSFGVKYILELIKENRGSDG